MPTNKQRRANSIEHWLRLGPLDTSDARKVYPSRSYARKCVCGLTYDKYGWLRKWQVVVGGVLCLLFLVVLAYIQGVPHPRWAVSNLVSSSRHIYSTTCPKMLGYTDAVLTYRRRPLLFS
jgi:hypothetical protein